jgi:hypothetical protein
LPDGLGGALEEIWFLQSYVYRNIGALQEEHGELDAAYRNILRSLELRRQSGFSVGVPFALIQQAEFIAQHYRDSDRAIELLNGAIDSAGTSHSTHAVCIARSAPVRLYVENEDTRNALS